MIDRRAAQNAGPENAEKSIMSPTFLFYVLTTGTTKRDAVLAAPRLFDSITTWLSIKQPFLKDSLLP